MNWPGSQGGRNMHNVKCWGLSSSPSLGGSGSDGGRDHPPTYHHTPRDQSTVLCCVKRPSLLQSQPEERGEKEAKTRALTRGWKETGVWMGRLEHWVWILLWGPSHQHFALHDSCYFCASAGVVSFPRTESFQLYLSEIPIGAAMQGSLYSLLCSESFPSLHLLLSGELTWQQYCSCDAHPLAVVLAVQLFHSEGLTVEGLVFHGPMPKKIQKI